MIAEAKHFEAFRFNDDRARGIGALAFVREVLTAVELDHQLGCMADEVGDVVFDWHLAAEGCAVQAIAAQLCISYAWGGESEKLVNELDQAFQNHGLTIVRDKRDLGFKGSIKGFMETIGAGKAVVLVISEKYLKSENCLFELLQVAKYRNLEGRIFPVVLEDARIYKAIDRIRYVRYWEEQLKELDDAMKTVSATNMHGFREDIDLYAEIRANLPRLTDILRDMNTLTPTIHRDEDFKTLFDAVMAKLKE